MAHSGNWIRRTTPEIQQTAQQMRAEMTPAEQYLWEAIKSKKLNGLRFRAQHPVGQFVLDFYCPICKLGIEVDGTVHDNQKEQDDARTEYIETFGYEVLRFSNEEIFLKLPETLDKIAKVAEQRIRVIDQRRER